MEKHFGATTCYFNVYLARSVDPKSQKMQFVTWDSDKISSKYKTMNYVNFGGYFCISKTQLETWTLWFDKVNMKNHKLFKKLLANIDL